MVTRHSITRVTCAGGAFLAVKQHLGHELHHVVSARSAISLRLVVFVVTQDVTRAARYPYKDQDASLLFRFQISAGKC